MSSVEDAEAEAFERRARLLLMESVERLPAGIRSRLTQARYRALDSRRSWSRTILRRWAPAGAAVAAVAFALLIGVGPHMGKSALNPSGPFANAAPEDLEMLADSDGVQLNADQDVDYDFYEWAVSEANNAGASVGT